MEQSHSTQLVRLVGYLMARPFRLKLLVVLGLLGLPFGLAWLDGAQSIQYFFAQWRTVVFPVVAIGYVVAVIPWIGRTERKVADGLRPLVSEDSQAYATLGNRLWWRSSRGDWFAFALGFLGGIPLLHDWGLEGAWHWAEWYILVMYLVVYGCLTWLIYTAAGSARLTALRHRYILHEDPFDLTCFEPVGQQGLVLALIFVGGILISLPFAGRRDLFRHWQTWVIYSTLISSTVLVFFVVMWPTHRTLQRVKLHTLADVQRAISTAFRALQAMRAGNADTRLAATELQAWITLEQRLKQTRTWPYDTEMLRILFLSILTPIAVGASRVFSAYLTTGRLLGP